MPAAGTPPAWRQARKPCRENPSCRARRPARPWLFSAAPVSRSCLCPLVLCAHGLAVRILQRLAFGLPCVGVDVTAPIGGVERLPCLLVRHRAILVPDSLRGGPRALPGPIPDRAFLIPARSQSSD